MKAYIVFLGDRISRVSGSEAVVLAETREDVAEKLGGQWRGGAIRLPKEVFLNGRYKKGPFNILLPAKLAEIVLNVIELPLFEA